MSDHSITSLIEKLEGAEVGSRTLDYATDERRDRYRRAVDRKVAEALAALKSEVRP